MTRQASILLVEDNTMDLELALDAFREVALANDIHVCRTGEEALDHLFGPGNGEGRPAQPPPDLILLDLKLPGIDGFEVLRRVKGADGLRRIPVVILSSSKDEGDRIMGYDCGANSYLVKPIVFDDFIRVVRTIGDYWLTLNANAPIDEGPHGP